MEVQDNTKTHPHVAECVTTLRGYGDLYRLRGGIGIFAAKLLEAIAVTMERRNTLVLGPGDCACDDCLAKAASRKAAS
jgi:hypothetical protein